MTTDDFDARLNALLEMPEGWELRAVKAMDGEWYCQISRESDGGSALAMREPTARAAIEGARQSRAAGMPDYASGLERAASLLQGDGA
jgi:hypothetical protein